MAKILILDIETAPSLAYVWRYFKENVGAKQVREHGHIMSFAAKWLGEDKVFYEENRKQDDTALVKKLLKFLDEADMVVAHNGERFDFPKIAGRAVVNGLKPPSPYKMVDTLKSARREFSFPSNSLEYLGIILGVDQKSSHKEFPGFELWSECMKGNKKAWAEMKKYNIQDVVTLEEIYLKLRPFMRNHPNVSVFGENEEMECPKCGSTHLQMRGYAYTNVGKFHRFQCQGCGGWGRTRYTIKDIDQNKNIAANVVS